MRDSKSKVFNIGKHIDGTESAFYSNLSTVHLSIYQVNGVNAIFWLQKQVIWSPYLDQTTIVNMKMSTASC